MSCSACSSTKSPKEIQVTLPTGMPYTPDIEILDDGSVSLQLFGSQKTLFWGDFVKMYQTVGSWDKFPLIEASYQNINYKLKFLWQSFVPGGGVYHFEQVRDQAEG